MVNVRPAKEHDLLTISNLLLSADGESDLTQTEEGRLLLGSSIGRDCGNNSYLLYDPRAGNLLPFHIRLPNDLSTGQTLLNGAISGTKVLSSFPNLITTFPTPASTTSPTPNFVCLTFSPVL